MAGDNAFARTQLTSGHCLQASIGPRQYRIGYALGRTIELRSQLQPSDPRYKKLTTLMSQLSSAILKDMMSFEPLLDDMVHRSTYQARDSWSRSIIEIYRCARRNDTVAAGEVPLIAARSLAGIVCASVLHRRHEADKAHHNIEPSPLKEAAEKVLLERLLGKLQQCNTVEDLRDILHQFDSEFARDGQHLPSGRLELVDAVRDAIKVAAAFDPALAAVALLRAPGRIDTSEHHPIGDSPKSGEARDRLS